MVQPQIFERPAGSRWLTTAYILMTGVLFIILIIALLHGPLLYYLNEFVFAVVAFALLAPLGLLGLLSVLYQLLWRLDRVAIYKTALEGKHRTRTTLAYFEDIKKARLYRKENGEVSSLTLWTTGQLPVLTIAGLEQMDELARLILQRISLPARKNWREAYLPLIVTARSQSQLTWPDLIVFSMAPLIVVVIGWLFALGPAKAGPPAVGMAIGASLLTRTWWLRKKIQSAWEKYSQGIGGHC